MSVRELLDSNVVRRDRFGGDGGHYDGQNRNAKAIRALTNLIEVTVGAKEKGQEPHLHIYSIKFNPPLSGDFRVQSKIINTAGADGIKKELQELKLKGALFTGTALLTIKETGWEGESRTFDKVLGGTNTEVQVAWKVAVPLSPMAITPQTHSDERIRAKMINAQSFFVDNAVRSALRANEVLHQLRDSFYKLAEARDISVTQALKLSLAKGFKTAALPIARGPHVALALNHLIIEGEARKLIEDIYSRTSGTEEERRHAVKDVLEGRTITTQHVKQAYTIHEIDYTKTADSMFESGGQQTSFRAYFKTRYDIDLPPGSVPPMLVCLRGRRECVIPPAVCRVTGAPKRGDERTRRTMISETRMDPTERMRHLNELLPLFGQAATANSLQESGIQLADQFLQVEGWELDKNLFKCDIGKRDTIDPSMLDQLQKQSVAKPPPLVVDQNSIMAVCVIHEQGERQLGPFLGALRTQLDTPEDRWKEAAQQGVERMLQMGNIDPKEHALGCLLLAIIPDSLEKVVYKPIKNVSYVQYAVTCQCIKRGTIEKKMTVVAPKLVTQIICKMGGHGWSIPAIKDSISPPDRGPKPTMAIGINMGKCLSSAMCAFTASVNIEFTSYVSVVEFLQQDDPAGGGRKQSYKEKEAEAFKHSQVRPGLRTVQPRQKTCPHHHIPRWRARGRETRLLQVLHEFRQEGEPSCGPMRVSRTATLPSSCAS
mmetsp:Transcript_36408/g.104332  ORF Transcript_36408/g.104332 Transcript_36408/m.104332 type:complete len:713 (+) Transcript_36408:2951-5089(+)